MSRSESALGPVRRHLVVALLLGGLGRVFVLNAPALADGVPLRFDEALSLFVAMALGGHWGALASLVATVGTPAPTFSALWASEALLVGAAVRRVGSPVLVTVAFWWLAWGLNTAGVLVAPQLGIDQQLALAKQLVNGALSAALAQLLLLPRSIRRLVEGSARTPDPPRLREQVASAFVPLVTLPLVTLGLGFGSMYGTDLATQGMNDLSTRATTTAARLVDYVAAAEGDVRTLAGHLAERPRTVAEIEAALLLHHRGSTVFITTLATDAQGTVLGATSRINSATPVTVRGPIGSVADRAYFLEPAKTGRPFTSDGLRGRTLGSDAIVAVSAPYGLTPDRFSGIAQGSLNLRILGDWLQQFVADTGSSIMVLDRLGQVIAATGPLSAPLLSDGRALPWVRATAAAEVGTFTDPQEATPVGRPERHAAVRREIPQLGWQLHIRRPMDAIQAPLTPYYRVMAAWLTLCLLIALPVAGRVARHITHPLELLAHTAESIGRGASVAQPRLPDTAPAEVRTLRHELEAMVARLDDSLQLLDQKVRERSAELAAATAQNDTIFQTAHDGMVVLDAARTIVEVNDAFCRMLGFAHDDLTGRPIADLELGITGEQRRQRVAQHARLGYSRFDSTLRTSSGNAVPVEVVVTDLPGGEGRVFAGVRDISERRRAEADRAQLESRLRQSQKMEAIGTLAGGIAHDFNNILTLIIGSADLAQASVPEGHPTHAYLDQILRASSRAEALVRQILTFSRRRDEQRDVVAVEPLVREAVAILRSTLPAMVEIRLDIAGDLPPVQADAVQLHQVLMNLGGNAAYAMRESGGVLTITLCPLAQAGSEPTGIVLTVSDTGEGMDRATLDRVFEPFFTTKPVGAGTGLGLAVVHGIITSHGGTIEATSERGRGTSFRITLPAALASTPLVDDTAVGASVAPAAPQRRARILVVDDEPELVNVVCKQLTRLGYVAQGCSGPFEALELLRVDDGFDIVVSDLSMPKMSGIEMAERIRAAKSGVAIVLCSGRVTDEDRERAERAGIREFLGKPFASHQLADVVARTLGADGTRH